MGEKRAKGEKRRDGLPEWKIPLIKAMLRRGGWKNEQIAFLVSTLDDTVNQGRVSDVDQGKRGKDIPAASDEELDRFLALREGEKADYGDPDRIYGPVHPNTLSRLFVPRPDKPDHLAVSESGSVEAKETYNTRSSKYIKTLAAFANAKGGYLLFGVVDKTFEVKGTDRAKFEEHDLKNFDNAIGKYLSASLVVEKGDFGVDGKFVGVIYIHSAEDKPVFSLSNDGELTDGAIYFRYPSQNLPIRSSDLRQILLEKERRVALSYQALTQRLGDIGATQAVVVDLETGRADGTMGHYLLSPESLKEIRLVDEGRFTEREGAPALKLIGTVEAEAPTIPVKEHLGSDDLITDFLNRETVPNPKAYLEELCYSSSKWLPVYSYARQAKLTEESLLDFLKNVETRKQDRKRKQISRVKTREKHSLAKKDCSDAVAAYRPALMAGPSEDKLADTETIKGILKVTMTMTGPPEDPTPIYDWLKALWQRPELIRGSYFDQLFRAAIVRLDDVLFGYDNEEQESAEGTVKP